MACSKPCPAQGRRHCLQLGQRLFCALALALASACTVSNEGTGSTSVRSAGNEAPIAADLIRAEWMNADNKEICPPIAFADAGDADGTERHAEFSGGWGVAFDLPGLRSAYGIAGTGLTDEPDMAKARTALASQWSLFRDIVTLPQPAFAGYGQEGARAYASDNPDGTGVNSLAYVRMAGAPCLYNVWSRLGRAHLELLLGSLHAL